MVGESNQNVFLIQLDASNFAEFEISEFEISRFACTYTGPEEGWLVVHYHGHRVPFLQPQPKGRPGDLIGPAIHLLKTHNQDPAVLNISFG